MSGEDTAEIMDTFREGLADKTTVFLAPASVSSERLIYFYIHSILENDDQKSIIWLCLKNSRDKIIANFRDYGMGIEDYLDRMWFIDIEDPSKEKKENTLYYSSQTDYMKIGSHTSKLFSEMPGSTMVIDDMNILSKDNLQVVENFLKYVMSNVHQHEGSAVSMLNKGSAGEKEGTLVSFFDVVIDASDTGEMHVEMGLNSLDVKYVVDKGKINLYYIQKKVKKERLKILIVDDEPDIPDLLKLSLKDEPYDFLVAYNGKDAIEIAREELPDLILLDIMMPDMDGYEVVEILKKKRDTRDIAIIMITAKTKVDDKLKGMELGIDDYISKPFDKREVNARIKMVMKRFGWKPPEEKE